MSAPELSDAERAVVDRFEAADPAPESLRERVAQAMFDEDNPIVHYCHDYWNRVRGGAETRDRYRRMAAAAIAVMRGTEC